MAGARIVTARSMIRRSRPARPAAVAVAIHSGQRRQGVTLLASAPAARVDLDRDGVICTVCLGKQIKGHRKRRANPTGRMRLWTTSKDWNT